MSKIFLTFMFLLAGIMCFAQPNSRIQARVDSLLQRMTLDEKIGQMVLYTSDWDVTGPSINKGYMDDIRNGTCGNIFNAYTAAYTRKLQKIAVEETRLHIPMLFGYDVIHGHKTIFPIPLGESASWDTAAIENSARVAATEAAAQGINWTFAPMCDITVDPRWGRVSEGAGEDPFLGSAIAKARVRGFQGRNNDLSDSLTILACVKHFAAYGAVQAGRDYNTVDMSERVFRDVYLPPYKAAIDQGAMSVMTSFNELFGVPATGNKWLLTDLLRKELGFKGFVVTDYTAINEMVNHGVAATESDAGLLAINAGVDMDMQGAVYHNYLKSQVQRGLVSEQRINESVRRILNVKFLLGLFDDPYKYINEEREKRLIYAPDHLKAAYDMAVRSMVLLKNDKQVLPLKKTDRIAVIGELANSKRDLLGSWKAAGDWDTISTVWNELKKIVAGKASYILGCKKMGDDRSGFNEALRIAKTADKVVLVIGEDAEWTGEASSRTNINIPGVQSELLEKLKKTGKPVIVVLMNGRPLDLSKEAQLADAILEVWFPGTSGGKAVADVLYGIYNPSGKLTITFPRSVGQIPIFYYQKNTGRPIDPQRPNEKYKSRYIDSPNDPLYPFGFGLSYTTFEYSDITLSDTVLTNSGIQVSVRVTNTGKVKGEEVVQMYVRDLVGSVTRPVKELKGFRKLEIDPGQSLTVTFRITPDMLAFHRLDMSYGPERGAFKVFVGTNSRDVKEARFVY